jgi:hypothetical protein
MRTNDDGMMMIDTMNNNSQHQIVNRSIIRHSHHADNAIAGNVIHLDYISNEISSFLQIII